MAHLVVVSFRLGSTDGVSIEAQKWIDGFRRLGHRVTTVAGDGTADVLVKGLAIRSTDDLDVARSRSRWPELTSWSSKIWRRYL